MLWFKPIFVLNSGEQANHRSVWNQTVGDKEGYRR